jgi:endonuclease YncB( thermonuclease family)
MSNIITDHPALEEGAAVEYKFEGEGAPEYGRIVRVVRHQFADYLLQFPDGHFATAMRHEVTLSYGETLEAWEVELIRVGNAVFWENWRKDAEIAQVEEAPEVKLSIWQKFRSNPWPVVLVPAAIGACYLVSWVEVLAGVSL